jgi:hypothetical protein
MRLALRVFFAFAAFTLFLREASAQISTIDEPAISVERLWLSPGPGGFVGGEGGEILAPGQWSLAVLASLMSDPIVLVDIRTDEVVSAPVHLRLGYELAVARSVNSRLQMGLAIPLVAAQEGERLSGIGLSEESLAAVAFSDIRLHAKLRLQPEARAPLSYGLSLYLALPTGDDAHFAGERGAVLSWTMVASYRRAGWRIAGNLGLRLRTQEVILLSPARPHGNEVIATVAAEYGLPARWGVPLGVLAELSQVEGDSGGASPGEVRGGVVAHLWRHARLKLIAGGGYTPNEVGAPAWRMAMIFERTTPDP